MLTNAIRVHCHFIACFSLVSYFLHLCLQISELQYFTCNCCTVAILPSLIRAQTHSLSQMNATHTALVNALIHSMWSGTRGPVKSNGVAERWAPTVQPFRSLCGQGASFATCGQLVMHYIQGNTSLNSGQRIRPFSSPLCMSDMLALNWLPSLILLAATFTGISAHGQGRAHFSRWHCVAWNENDPS